MTLFLNRTDDDLGLIFAHLKAPLVAHSRLNHWRADLLERVWRQRAIIKRRGFPGADWDLLLDELEEFAFVEQSMSDEIARRRAKEAA
jgi:hypothetical protein